MNSNGTHWGRPVEDRQALASEELYGRLLPAVQLKFDLRDDQLAEVLYELGVWYADVEIGYQGAGDRRGAGRKGGAA